MVFNRISSDHDVSVKSHTTGLQHSTIDQIARTALHQHLRLPIIRHKARHHHTLAMAGMSNIS